MQDANRRLLDDFGHCFERFGLSYNAGRIYGLALMAAGPLSQEEIAVELDISQSVVSSTVRHLVLIGYLESVRVRGDRKLRYQFAEGSGKSTLEAGRKRFEIFNALIERAAEVELGDEARRRVRRHAAFMRYVMEGYERLLAEWDWAE